MTQSTPPRIKADTVMAVLAIAAGLFALFVWIPLDADSGLVETVRRQVRIGDGLGPSVAACFILLGGVMVLFQRGPSTGELSSAHLRFVLSLLVIFALSIALMRWTGPLVVALADRFTEEPLTYRNLRDTAPWKYLGFFVGGTLLILTLISLSERRVSMRGVLIAVLGILFLIALYDLPFDDLLLPPNGDV